MKNLIYLIIYIVVSFILQTLGIWWLPALAAIGLGFILKDQSTMTLFAMGFLGLLLLWSGWALYSDGMNDGILSSKIGELFNGLSGISLIAITGLLGGLMGGLGSVTGKFAQEALK